MKRSTPLLILFALFVLLPCLADAKPSANVKVATDRVENTDSGGIQRVLVPYAFSTEGMGFTVGAGGLVKGLYQEQLSVGGTLFGGPENYGGGFGMWDLRFPRTERLFLTTFGMLGYFPRQRAYAAPRNSFWPADIPPPGSNDSSQDLVLETSGVSNWWDIKVEYALPIGATRKQGMINYRLAQGMLVSEPSGGRKWNPLTSGSSVLMLRQYNRFQTFETDVETFKASVHAWELGLLYDNTDFPVNPSYGSSQYLAMHYDPAWFGSTDKWSFLEFEASKYFSLGDSRHALQRVMALNAWSGYSPSWGLDFSQNGGSRVTNAPPFTEGSTLGGLYRLRGYDQYRFQDKAAIYATAEYRYTLRWNPLRGVSWLQFLASDWFQLVVLAEGGRVGSSYTTQDLLTDWKSDVGLALRGMFGGVVVRLDMATSDEGTNIWAMVSQPF